MWETSVQIFLNTADNLGTKAIDRSMRYLTSLIFINCMMLHSGFYVNTCMHVVGKCSLKSEECVSVSRPVRQRSQEVQRVQSAEDKPPFLCLHYSSKRLAISVCSQNDFFTSSASLIFPFFFLPLLGAKTTVFRVIMVPAFITKSLHVPETTYRSQSAAVSRSWRIYFAWSLLALSKLGSSASWVTHWVTVFPFHVAYTTLTAKRDQGIKLLNCIHKDAGLSSNVLKVNSSSTRWTRGRPVCTTHRKLVLSTC